MLQLHKLTLYRGNKRVCEELSLDIEKGNSCIISGKNGSGKSSLIDCLIGRIRPQSGQVLLDGSDLSNLSMKDRRVFAQSTGVVLQEPLLRPQDTIRKTLHQGSKEEVQRALTFLDLQDFLDHLVQDLSFSQRRKLDLVRSLIHSPRMIIWDEPFLGLDRSTAEHFHSLLLELKQGGATIIISTLKPYDFLFLNPEKIIELH